MIQRKQSVYLLLVAVLMSWLLIRPYAEISINRWPDAHFSQPWSLRIYSAPHESEYIKYTMPLVLLVILITGALNFVNIFFYNRRILQIRLCIISAVLLVIILN